MKAKRKPAIADLYKKFEKAYAKFQAIDRAGGSGEISKAGELGAEYSFLRSLRCDLLRLKRAA